MDFDKKEFYGIVAKAKKQMQITIDQDCNVADTKPDVEKMIQTRGIVKIQETEMMVDRVRIKGEFVFQGLYGTNDTSAYLESLEYSLPFEEYVHIEGVLPSDYVKVKYTIDDINTILINSRKISIRVLLTFSFQITEEMKEKGIIEIHEENVSVLKKDVQITDLIVNKKDIARLKDEHLSDFMDTGRYGKSAGKNWRAHDRDSGCNAYICIISWRRCPDAGTVCEMGDSGRYAAGML